MRTHNGLSISVKRIASDHLTTKEISAESVRLSVRLWESRTCAHSHVHLHPTSTFCRTPSLWVSNHIPNFGAIRPAVSEIPKRGTSALVHKRAVHMYPNNSLCNMQNHLLRTQQIWSLSGEPFRSCSLAANFTTLHKASATCQVDPPNEPNLTVLNAS